MTTRIRLLVLALLVMASCSTGDALWCLAGCNPYAQGCTTACISETSQAQAEKTGRFLQCVLDVCPLAEVGTTCDVPTACVLKCPEVI